MPILVGSFGSMLLTCNTRCNTQCYCLPLSKKLLNYTTVFFLCASKHSEQCCVRQCLGVCLMQKVTCCVYALSPPGAGVVHLECTADSERASPCAALVRWAGPSPRLPFVPLPLLPESESGSWTSLSVARFAGNESKWEPISAVALHF